MTNYRSVNALAELLFQGLKRELLHGRSWTSKAQTRLKLFRRLSYTIGSVGILRSATSHQPSSNSN